MCPRFHNCLNSVYTLEGRQWIPSDLDSVKSDFKNSLQDN